MKATLISAFADELEKDAAVPKLLQSLWRSGAGRAIAGGAVGAAGGAAADSDNRLRGALMGGLLGAGGGYAAPLVTRAGRKQALEGLKFRGAKLKHEITGRGRAPVKGAKTGQGYDPVKAQEIRKLEALGLTSVPGAIKGMATKPLQTLKGAWKHSGGLGKAMAVGDVAMGVPHVLDASTQAGTGEKALGTLGSSAGYLLGGRMGMLGSMALGSGLGFLGGRAGRIFGGGNREAPAPGPALARPATMALDKAVGTPVRQAVPEVGRLIGPG